ncbi:efflux RND transporter periplasmic adaptor subunit [Candidatus Marinarcus aquaticus]|uniref:CzcB-like barrel-sandwich hybrid domain-containing protein n=1 Tax=Candidatus Marinarcus aquaticus TaxID=2044504 RepID=A0A4V1LPB3_9BACT|nr:efflux RND transporter periplasmic adaptor subunit [Candidatus Marinarcus aquaticus]RXJ60598.1 hypothetical protein CRV04_00895 [Candidatus Marinarcus aquaticus]
MIKKIGSGLLIALLSSTLYAQSLVEVTTVKKGEVNPLQTFVGTLLFDKSSTLAAQNAGVVKTINFEVGDEVKKGEVLVQIDSDLLDAQINAAKANLTSALSQEKNSSKDFARYAKLLESKSITQKEYDDALTQSDASSSSVKALRAQLKELQIQKNRKSIKAPYDGVVVEKLIDLGEWVNAGTAVAKMVNPTLAEVTFNTPLNIVQGLQKEQEYEIVVGDATLKGRLLAAIPSGDRLTRTFPVKFQVKLNNGFFYDGQEAKVSLAKQGKMEAFIVPRDAVIKRFDQQVIFLVNEQSQAAMLPVKVVGYLGKDIAILAEGLTQGATVVKKGNERIFPNSPLTIINNK